MAKDNSKKKEEKPTKELAQVTKEEVQATDNVHFVLRGPDGEIKHESTHNVTTAAGKNGIAAQILASPDLGKPTHFAAGTGVPGANALGAEIARVAVTSKTRSGNVVTVVSDLVAGVGTGALTEAGIADASSGGNFWTTANFAAINKGALDILTTTWTLTIN